MTRNPLLIVAGLAVASLLAPMSARAQYPVTTVMNNGPSANRVDMVVVGDGYTADEIASGKYAQDVDALIAGYFGGEAYAEYRSYFNVHRVDVPSAESGADHPPGIYRNTAFDAAYNCGGIQRLICVSDWKVLIAVEASLPDPASRDMILVLVNDTEYGGSGGSVAVVSTHASSVGVALHEMGHTFALLADEYTSSPPACDCSEPSAANVTTVTARDAIKWARWIDQATPIPTTSTTGGVPGLYVGAMYCTSCKYRPTYLSKMRALNYPFEQINTEQHVKRIYNRVYPIDASSPAESSVTIPVGGSQRFFVAVPAPQTHQLTVTWTLDGATVGSGAQYVVDDSVGTGAHTVQVAVRDETPMVRDDPAGLLQQSMTWSVTVEGAHPLTFTEAPRGVPVAPGEAGTAALSALAVDSAGHGVGYTWTASCPGQASNGTFTPMAAVRQPVWTSPATGATLVTCTIRVTATCASGLSETASFALAVRGRVAFVDDPLQARSTPVRAQHITELRRHVSALRARQGLTAVTWTDGTLTPGVTPIRAVHLLELRTRLGEVYQAAGRALPQYTDAVSPIAVIGARQIEELRSAIAAMW